LPIGAIIATMPHLAGSYSCVATTVADANGFVLCNGQTIADASSPMNGVVIPNINNDVFLMGTAGATNGATVGANTKDYSHPHSVSVAAANLPAHAHSIDHDHAAVTSGNQSADHSHTFSGTSAINSVGHSHSGTTATGGAHNHSVLMASAGDGLAYFRGTNNTPTNASVPSTDSSHAHSFTTGDVSANHTHTYSGTTSGVSVNHTHSVDVAAYTGSSGNGPGSGTAITSGSALSSSFDVRPKYISAKFIMRIK
jgi:hypothetical protein